MGRPTFLALALFLTAPVVAGTAPRPAAGTPPRDDRPHVIYRMYDSGKIEKVAAPARVDGRLPGVSLWSAATGAGLPSTAAIADTDTSYVQLQYGFDRPSDGACLPRGWTAQERASLVFAHVDTKYLVNDAYITMGSKALWFGTDMGANPEEVQNWYYPSGYGAYWSQRLTSTPFTNGNLALTFEGRVDFQTTGTIIAATSGNNWLGVQGLKSDGKWGKLAARWVSSSGFAFTSTAPVRGKGEFKCTVATHPDSQPGFPFASPTRLRLVLQTNPTTGDEVAGGLGTSPTPEGAAIVDNLRLRDLGAGPDPIPLRDFEDGALGTWTLSALNGTPASPQTIRDIPAPDPNISLAKDFDPNDPSCLWQFTAPGGEVPAGRHVYLTSPWFAREVSPDSTFTIDLRVKFAPNGINPFFLGRFVTAYLRGKNAGDTYQRRFFARCFFLVFEPGTSDAEMAPEGSPFHYPSDFVPTGSVHCDSLQLVFVILDSFDRFNVDPATRAPTRLPWIDDVRLVRSHADSDYDGVSDTFDACPSVCAAGQDADGDGCVDATATLRHVESWASSSLPIHYRISQNGDPRISDGSDLQALRNAFATWAAVPGANVQVVEDPITPQKDASATDFC